MRPSLEAEINDLEKRIATLEKNKIGNLRREHGEIVSSYEKMFDTLRFVNFNKILMVLKINMMEIKTLEEDCSKECTKNQLVILLQKEMANCLLKMIQIGHEENSLIFESNQRLRDKIRLKRLEMAKMLDEKEKLLAKINRQNKFVVQEKNIDRYCVSKSSKCDMFSPTYDTAGYHPKILKQSKIPVLKLPLTSVVETVPFQIRKKPIKVTIPLDRPSVLKKPYPGRVVKPKITHNCERKSIAKTESFRLGEKQKQHGKRAVIETFGDETNGNSINDNVVIANKTNENSINNNVMVAKNANVENNSAFLTPKSASKIPVRATPSAKKSSNKGNRDTENLTPVRAKLNGVDDNQKKTTTNNNINNNNNTIESQLALKKPQLFSNL
ncbi:hypothetical protein LSTR_LSTR009561 [Laodelphax striatellus]|uniref:Uncharacterized protein n=1 Tax=Laodelphax striatellus TaxID=195883 RepID=A0A482WS70_LAOST|nr:hypothetical protein LSTR_LSTR009561 [Laodelphax striatellus]